MSEKTNYFKLGLFIIIACLLFAGFLISFGSGKFFKKELLMETFFNESVQGLEVGSEVTYKGVRIGRVEQITTATHIYGVSSDYILVIFSVRENTYAGQQGKTVYERMERAIDKGLKVRISFKGVTGVAFLEMDYVTNGKDDIDISWEPKHLYIPSQKSQMANIGEALNTIMDNLNRINIGDVTQSFYVLLKTLNEKAEGLDTSNISTQMDNFFKEIRATNSRISKALDSKEFQEMMGNAKDSFSTMKQLLNTVEKSLPRTLDDLSNAAGNASQITSNLNKEMLGESGALSVRLTQLMDSLNRTADMLETVVWTNSDAVGKIVEDFSRSAENLNQLINELRYYPGRILMEKPPRIHEKEKKYRKP